MPRRPASTSAQPLGPLARRAVGFALALGAGGSLVACPDLDRLSANLGVDAAEPDATDAESFDAGPDAAEDAALVTYARFDAPSQWETFDLRALNPNAGGFIGGTFDHDALYFMPYSLSGTLTSIIPRFDIRGSFANVGGASWSLFDTKQLENVAGGFCGGAFDGKYIYALPFSQLNPAGTSGRVVRYDKSAPYLTATSWSTYDVSAIDARAKGFCGAIFDGRFLYLVPDSVNQAPVVARYDTTAPFNGATSWTVFALGQVGVTNTFLGGTFDGRYVYLAPEPYDRGAAVVVRYDTQSSFEAPTSWETLPLANVHPSCTSYRGATVAAGQVYFFPSNKSSALRYDPSRPFGDPRSWTAFDLAAIRDAATLRYGGTFDGRFVYYAPGASTLAVRYDTTLEFAQRESWGTFDLATLNARASNFAGALFDGQHVTFVPNPNGLVVRFEATSAAATPPETGSSF